MRKLSPDQITSITNLVHDGKSTREIGKILGCGQATVVKYRKIILNEILELKPGRPQKLSPRDKRAITRLILSGRAKTAVGVSKILNFEREDKVSAETIRRALKGQGLKAIKKKKKPKLSKVHRKARLDWALRHENWTTEDWKRVIWSDETKVNRLNSDGIKCAWVQDKKNLEPKVIEETLKFGGSNLMIWGCMSWYVIGGIGRIVGKMDSKQPLEILDVFLLPTLDRIAGQPGSIPKTELIFQQDNDPKHTSLTTRRWLATKSIKTMNWPSQSPDLNPIEHLWGRLKCRLGEYPEPPKGIHDLWERVEETWNILDPDLCKKLVESMPSRIAAVIKAKGGHTKF